MDSVMTDRKHVPALDGLRGMAILLVMAYHFAAGVPAPHAVLAKVLRVGTSGTWIGVDVFFVLSGFLITGILLRAKGNPGYFRNFYARRLLRIFPVYYAVLAVLFVVVPAVVQLDGPSRGVYALRNWLWAYSGNVETALSGRFEFDGGIYQLDHFWSLAVEEHFYLVWPALVFVLSEGALLATSIGIVSGVLLLRIVLTAAHVFSGTLYMLTPCRIDAMAVGAAVALLARRGGLAALERFSLPAVATCLAFLAISLGVRHSLDPWAPSMTSVGYSVVDLGAAALLVLALARPAVARALETPSLRAAGKYSYCAYVVHWLLQGVFQALYYDRLASLGYESMALVVYMAASAGSTMLLSALVWYGFERPILEMKRFFVGVPSYRAP
jgi:peptidoglycan/LPS O-acetylase OafA/YrhL